jgi:TonB family protein
MAPVLLVVCVIPLFADLKIHYLIKNDKNGTVVDQVVYLRNNLKRVEDSSAKGLATIWQCESHRSFIVSDANKLFMQRELMESETVPLALRADLPTPTQKATCGTVYFQAEELDAGERKELFNSEARKAKITYIFQADQNSCTHMNGNHVLEGWFLASPLELCPTEESVLVARASRHRDKLEVKSQPSREQLIPLDVTRIITDRAIQKAKFEIKAVEVSTDPLPDSLFEVPPEYREAFSRSELLGGAVTAGFLPGTTDPIYLPASNITPPRVLERTMPEFTGQDRARGVHGEVQMNVLVDQNGLARDVTVEKSLDPVIDERSMEAVKKWKFQPAIREGKPVAYRMRVSLLF